MGNKLEIFLDVQTSSKFNAQGAVEFVENSASFLDMEQTIINNGYNRILVKDIKNSPYNFITPGQIIHPNELPFNQKILYNNMYDAVMYVDFDRSYGHGTRFDGRGLSGRSSVEEIIFHELSHLYLNHLNEQTSRYSAELQTIQYTNENFRSEFRYDFGLTDRVNHNFSLDSIRDSVFLFQRKLDNRCFPPNTTILLPDNQTKHISNIRIGDTVLAPDGLGDLKPCKVTRLYRNVTTEWLELVGPGIDVLHVTPDPRP